MTAEEKKLFKILRKDYEKNEITSHEKIRKKLSCENEKIRKIIMKIRKEEKEKYTIISIPRKGYRLKKRGETLMRKREK